MAAPEPRRFEAHPSVREEGWEDPGPRVFEPVHVPARPAPGPVPLDPCPLPRPCCDEIAAHFAERNGIFTVLCNVPFIADRATPPTVYACSDGGHGGMVEIRFCPFCGLPLAWRYDDDGSST